MVTYNTGAKGLYWVSQIAVGGDNALRVRIFGFKGSASKIWAQENRTTSRSYLGQPVETLSRGRDGLYPMPLVIRGFPAGAEGYFEAFSNIYATFNNALLKHKAGEALTDADLDFPKIAAGITV